MQTKDKEILELIEAIGEHYRTNLGNRFIRNEFSILPIDAHVWALIESVTEKSQYYSLQGYHLDELYDRILALAQFVYHARRELQPQLRARLTARSKGPGPGGNERILRDMAVNNFAPNLAILADMVNKLYTRAVEVDMETHRHGIPVYKNYRGLDQIGAYLVPT
jgi:hypothetical protein